MESEVVLTRLLSVDDDRKNAVTIHAETAGGPTTIVIPGDMVMTAITLLASCSKVIAAAAAGHAVPVFQLVDCDVKASHDGSLRLGLSPASGMWLWAKVPKALVSRMIAKLAAAAAQTRSRPPKTRGH